MDQDNTKIFISFLMDASDVIERAKQEFRGMVESGVVISRGEHEAISDLIAGAASDVDILDDYNARYENVIWLQKFAPIGKKFEEIKTN